MELPYAPPRETAIAPRVIALLFLLAGAILLLAGCATQPAPQTVAQVDLSRYSGKWYEIASYPAWFQRKCAGGTTALYTAEPDGSIRVVNSCLTRDGKREQSVGRAVVVPGSHNAKLKVSFGLPFATGDYWILGMDDKNYRWALVGHPSRKYLWILAREPHVPESLYREIVKKAVAEGYDPAKLRKTDHSHGG